jgi:hypothetical protein
MNLITNSVEQCFIKLSFVKQKVKLTHWVRCKVVPVFDQVPRYEDEWGSGGIASRTPNLGTRWR